MRFVVVGMVVVVIVNHWHALMVPWRQRRELRNVGAMART